MKNITFCMLMFYGIVAHAQLIVTNTVETPAQLVQNVLVDASVNPTNITFNGTAASANAIRDQAAHFTTNFNPTNLGLNEGLLLTTGKAQVALGPNNSGNLSIVTAFPVPGDPDLAILAAGNAVRNAAVLEFDFVATGLELNFDYVFASEEYPEYSNSAFNDAFGFFLRGPGITGPFTGGAKNIALIPSTTIPITINNVNNGTTNAGPCDNCAFYVNNGTGTTPALNPHIQYDGFTTVLRATSALICGETYHIKLAVANVSDNAWDSAVFLKNFRIKPLELVDNLNLSENLDVCFGQTVTIASGIDDTDAVPEVFVWSVNTSQPYDPTAFTVISTETGPSLTTTTGGVYQLEVYTDYGCLLAKDQIEIRYRPEIPIQQPQPINICTLNPVYPFNQNINQTAYIMTPLNPADYIVTYYSSSYDDAFNGVLTGIIPNGNLANYPITGPTTTIWIRIEEQFGSGCVLVKPFTINVSPEPSGTFSYAGPFCANASALPVAPTTTVTPGGTYNTSSAGLVINPVTGEIDLALSSPGNYTVNYHLPASGSCPDFDVTNVPVTITAAPAAPTATSPVVYCQGQTASALTATGTGLLWYAAATGGTGSATAPTPDTSLPGNVTYYVSQTNGCEGPRKAIVVTVNATPPLPTFSAVAPYCQNATASALTATGTGLLWYTAATGGIGSATAPTPSTATAGIVNYYVSQTVSGCESGRAAIPVETIALPSAPGVTSPIGYCQNDVPAALTATGSNLLWYAAAVGGVGNASAPAVSTVSVTSTTYYVSQTVNGCEGPRAAITVNVTAVPSAPAVVSPLTYCQNEVAPALTAVGSGLLWYAAATGGTGSATAPVPATGTSGSVTYYVSQSTGCEGPRAAITVNVTATPPAPVVSPVVYCQNAPSSALTAAGTALLWYTAATGGVGSASAPIPGTAASGTTTYYVSQTVSSCESPRAALVVSVTALPTAPTVNNLLGYCQGTVAPALTATGSGLLWYAAAVGGTGNASAPVPATASIGNTTYYVSQTVNGCEGPRAMITVEVYTIPNAPTVAVVQPTCSVNTGTISVSAPLGVNLEYSINNGINFQSGTSFAGVAAGANYNVVVRNALTGCTSTATVAAVNPALVIPAAPTAAVTFQPNCITPTATIEISAPLGANLEYSIDGGINYQAGTTFSGLTPNAAYSFIVRDVVNTCTSTATVVNVNPIPANPAAPTLNIVQPICTTPTATIRITAPLGANLEYSIDGGINYQPAPEFAGLAPNANYNLMVRDAVTGCVSATSVGVVDPIPANPAVPTVTAVQPTCAVNTGGFTITAPTGANLVYSIDGGINYQPGATFTGLAAGVTYNPIVKNTLTGCVSAPGNVVINPALNVPVAPTMSVTFQPICSTPTGTIVVTAPLGANLVYSINNGTNFQAGTTFAGLAPNTTYNVIVKDNVSGCVSTASSATVNPLPANPSAPTASTTVQPNCIVTTGTIVITAPLGANLVYSINNGTNYQLGTTFAGLAPGTTYNLIVRNTVTGCVSAPTAVIVNPIPANPSAPTAVITQPTCNVPVGAINISAPLGADLQYSINNGTNYQTGTSFAGLAPNATYNIIVRNTVTGCVSTPSAFVIIPAPTFPATPVASGSNVCAGDAIALSTPTVAGASYSWTGPNGFTSSAQNPTLNNATASMSGTYSVVISTTADCPSAPGSVNIVVNPLPQPTLIDGYVCFNVETNTVLNPYTLNAGLSDAQYDFEWFEVNAASFDPIAGEVNSSYTAMAPGVYGVRATNVTTGCVSAIVQANVAMSSPPLAVVVSTSDYFADNQMITVNVAPVGVYEYQLDNGAFQSSNVFQNLPSGHHTVTVRNECGQMSAEAFLIDYPRFFTPNGDGYNDTWNIFALSGQANAKIYIFDRYGKLLKQISPSGSGWDGTFTLQGLPSTDYWFTVEYEENNVRKEFKSHFALKR
ncbi:choice-of-anchor L domain-containing protein [Flavobacterium sp.]|uniref:choice-of-anchor L domain-containing protein n=1 Tax=Flavobacterium sp. TaxID=239 RepID=UPI0039E4B276